MKLSTRLALSFGTVIASLAVVAGVGVSRLDAVHASLDTVVNDQAPKLEALNDMAFRSMENARFVRGIILLTDEKQMVSNNESIEKNLAANTEHLAYLKKQLTAPVERALLEELALRRAAYASYTTETVKLGLANKKGEATAMLYGENYKTQAPYFAAIRKLIDYEKAAIDAAAAEATASYRFARNLIVSLGALAVLVGAAMALVFSRGLLGQLGGEPDYAATVARRIAAGDLASAIEIKGNHPASLLSAMKAMQVSLVKVVSNVRQNSESVATASAQIAQGNLDLSERTEQQASALEQTAASMEQLSASVKQNADGAKQANQLAQGASSVAVKGGEVVGKVVHTMKGINDSSKKIADIISVIDGIAFQTNILALNAAVEAARAGEQGRGFAVVASEVRSLAGRSAEAAKEIKSLISTSVERVEAGTALVDQAGVTMTEVVGSIKRLTDIMGEISAASTEQSTGVAQVGEAVTLMDQATQQNAALVEESAAAAASLKVQAQQLVQAVSVFKLADERAHGLAAVPV